MTGLTVIYYTGGYEKPALLKRVQDTLVQNMGHLPLISVSQEPLELGRNICVGHVGRSTQNTFRQLQIGAMHAKTQFVCTAEDDCLYPPEYFQYRPESTTHIYCAMPMYAMYARTGEMRRFIPKKYGSLGASVMGREALIEALDGVLQQHGMWGPIDEPDLPNIYLWMPRRFFTLPQPVVSIKTDQALHRRTGMYPGICEEVPYWGSVQEVMERYVS